MSNYQGILVELPNTEAQVQNKEQIENNGTVPLMPLSLEDDDANQEKNDDDELVRQQAGLNSPKAQLDQNNNGSSNLQVVNDNKTTGKETPNTLRDKMDINSPRGKTSESGWANANPEQKTGLESIITQVSRDDVPPPKYLITQVSPDDATPVLTKDESLQTEEELKTRTEAGGFWSCCKCLFTCCSTPPQPQQTQSQSQLQPQSQSESKQAQMTTNANTTTNITITVTVDNTKTDTTQNTSSKTTKTDGTTNNTPPITDNNNNATNSANNNANNDSNNNNVTNNNVNNNNNNQNNENNKNNENNDGENNNNISEPGETTRPAESPESHEPSVSEASSTEYDIGILPELPPEMKNKKCLVLDLDETLVHSSFKPIPAPDFIIPVEIENVIHKVYVKKRPYVDEFLLRSSKVYEMVIFTASLGKYANPLLDQLDIHKVIEHRLFRESCVLNGSSYVKDLRVIGRKLKNIIFVDNSPHSYAFQPRNAVPIITWFDDMDDTCLLDLLPVLETTLANCKDVRNILDADNKSYRWLCNQANQPLEKFEKPRTHKN